MQQALEIIIGGLLQGGAFALVALGFALIFRVTGTINLAQGAYVVVGALLLYTFHQGSVTVPSGLTVDPTIINIFGWPVHFVAITVQTWTFQPLWPLWISFIAALAVTTLIGILLAKFVLEPALRKLPLAGMVIMTAG